MLKFYQVSMQSGKVFNTLTFDYVFFSYVDKDGKKYYFPNFNPYRNKKFSSVITPYLIPQLFFSLMSFLSFFCPHFFVPLLFLLPSHLSFLSSLCPYFTGFRLQ